MEKDNLKAGVLYKFFFTANDDLYFGYIREDGSDSLMDYMLGPHDSFEEASRWSMYPGNSSGSMNSSVNTARVASEAEKVWFQACMKKKSFVKMSESAHYEIY